MRNHDRLAADPDGFQAALQGTGLYIADDSTTRVVNVATIQALNLTGAHLNVPGVMFPSYDGVAAAPGRAYVSVNGLLGVFDITDAFSPVLQGTVSIKGGGRLSVTDDEHLVVTHSSDGFGLYDVSNATDPVEVGTAIVPQANIVARDVVTHGEYVYATTSNGKVFTFDISSPDEPVVAHELDIGQGPAYRAHAGSTYLFVLQNGSLHLVADLPGYCTAVCGNGTIEYPEACDDGNAESGDGCDVDCTL